ncbi:MAG: porin family protein [Candidatus Eisenbacteria bacterium]
MRSWMVPLLIAVSLGVALASEPLTPAKPVTFALKGGISQTTPSLDPDPGAGDGAAMGYGGGVTIGLNLSSHVSFDAEVLYARKGGKYSYSTGDPIEGPEGRLESRVALDYVTLSPLLRATFRPHGASPYLLAGAEFGFLMNAEWEWSETTGGSGTWDAKDEFEETDFSLSFGGGLDLPASGTTNFFVEARYYYGMTDISKTPYSESIREDTSEMKNRGTYLFGGLRF